MYWIMCAGFLVAGIINTLPLIGLLGAERLSALYGVPVEGADMAVLLRHRALLFGIVGVLLFAAIAVPSLRLTAILAGMVSMVGYLILMGLEGETNAELRRVALADIVGIAGLAVAATVHFWRGA